MRRHGPHSESHWATTCSAMLQNTRHRVSCVTGIQPTAGAVTFIFAQSRYSDYTTGWSIRHSIPGQGQIFSSPNPPYHHWDITSFFFNRYWWHFPLWQSGRCVKGNTHHLVPSVRTSRAIQPSPPPYGFLGRFWVLDWVSRQRIDLTSSISVSCVTIALWNRTKATLNLEPAFYTSNSCIK